MLTTRKGVQLSAYRKHGSERLPAPPVGLKILERSGLRPSEPGVAAGSASPPLPELEPVPERQPARRDRELKPARFELQDPPQGREPPPDVEVPEAAPAPGRADGPPRIDLPPIEGEKDVVVPNLTIPTTSREPSPCPARAMDQPAPPLRREKPDAVSPAPAAAPSPPSAPILAGTQRVTSIFPRSGRKVDIQFNKAPDGTITVIYRGGVNIVTRTPQFGVVDLEAESAVIWRHPDPKEGEKPRGPNGELIEDANQPMEVYLEGDVILRQDENKVAGKADQRTFRGEAGLLRLPDRPVPRPRRARWTSSPRVSSRR